MYGALARFLAPLVLTLIVQELGGQFLNSGMARLPQATQTLAAYGLAWGLVSFWASPLSQVRQISLVLATSRRSLRHLLGLVVVGSIGLTGVLLLLACTPLGIWVVGRGHGVAGPLLDTVLRALFWLAPYPIFYGMSRFLAGLLLQVRRPAVITWSTLASIGLSITLVLTLVPTEFIRTDPIRLPLLVTYGGALLDMAILAAGYYLLVRGQLQAQSANDPQTIYVLRFFWPLALVMAIQGLSRPAINLYVGLQAGGEAALAVLTVVYTVAHTGYGWLNEMRSLAPAFVHQQNSLRSIQRFALAAGLVSFAVMGMAFWTPVREFLLVDLIGVQPNLAAQCRIPLMLFTFFPLVVALRAHWHGVALVQHRTQALWPSAPARLGAILVSLYILNRLGLEGAALGVAALLVGFTAEGGAVWWMMRGSGRPSKGKGVKASGKI
ncbi:MAG: hypothetical protein GKR89_31765 [Candidatus Latescibacteria bacterium]|nr:hypothetical protein [Candidatus Latescibacterota bacterium]